MAQKNKEIIIKIVVSEIFRAVLGLFKKKKKKL